MRWRLAALVILLFTMSSASAFADTFSYSFIDNSYATPLSFTYVSPILMTTKTTFTPLTCTYAGGGVCTSIVLNPGKANKAGAYKDGDLLFNIAFYFPDGTPNGTGRTDEPVLGDLGKLGTQVTTIIGGTQTLTITRNVIAATPEPSSLALLGTGLLACTAMIRRRFRVAAST